MLFGKVLESDTTVPELNAEDRVLAQVNDPAADTDESQEILGSEVEELIQAEALSGIAYLDGGEEAKKNFIESAEVQALVEARKMSKKTFVRLNRSDDFVRRAHLASLLLARNAKDPLFNKLALNRVKERQLRSMFYYGNHNNY